MTQITFQGTDVLQTGGVTQDEPLAVPEESGAVHGRLSVVTRQVSALRAVPNIGTWTGVAVSTIGLVLLVVAWGKTAGLTNVALQIPYLVSAGFTGIGLVLVGLTIVNVAAKRQDSLERTAQLSELRGLLHELRRTVEGDE